MQALFSFREFSIEAITPRLSHA